MRLSKSERVRILVTGASGAYGSAFAKHCLDQGHEVHSIRYRERPYDSAKLLGIADQITWYRGDIRDVDFISMLLAETDIGFVVHFAAKPLVKTGTLVPRALWDVNVAGTIAVLEATKQASIKRPINFLYVSSDKVYGYAGDIPYTEDMSLLGNSIYETSKIAAEMACRAYHTHGFVKNVVISRSCNIIARAETSWRLCSNTVRQFLTNHPAKIFTHAQFQREWLDVRDAVVAQYQLLMRADELSGQIFNIGSGISMTQEEVIFTIKNNHFPDGHIIHVEPPPMHQIEIPYQILNTNKIKKVLGWAPRYGFNDAIAEVVEFWKEHRDLAPWSLL